MRVDRTGTCHLLKVHLEGSSRGARIRTAAGNQMNGVEVFVLILGLAFMVLIISTFFDWGKIKKRLRIGTMYLSCASTTTPGKVPVTWVRP